MYYVSMVNHGYFSDRLNGQVIYRCLKCRFDTFNQLRIQSHVRSKCIPVPLPETGISTSDWVSGHKNTLNGLEIGISFLTWNTKAASVLAAEAIISEAQRLRQLNVKTSLFWADNGSDDGTVEAVSAVFGCNLAAKFLNLTNLGQSQARNDLKYAFLQSSANYLLMVDGDIEIIPYSSFAMARYLTEVNHSIGCIGMYSPNCTDRLDLETATCCRKIDHWMVNNDPGIAWTNYGLFRRAVMRKATFDENGPFAGPGWGFEDDDFYLQMLAAGCDSYNTKYFRHLHRKRHSSLRLLNTTEQAKTFAARKQYLAAKWAGHSDPRITHHIRRLINQTPPVLL